MGMAASQARLLFITARLHDVELRAQQLLAAKVQLATQSDAAWSKYNEAIDATTLTANALNMKTGQTSTIVATFSSLTGPNAIYGATGDRYGLVTAEGELLLSELNNKKYNDFKKAQPNGDADDFAMYMMGLDISKANPETIKAQEKAVLETTKNEDLKLIAKKITDLLTTWDQENGKTEVDKKNEEIRSRNEKKKTDYEDALEIYNALTEDEKAAATQPEEPVYEKELSAYQGRTITDVYDTNIANGGLTLEQKGKYDLLIKEFSKLAQEEFTDENYEAIVGDEAFDEDKYDYFYDMFMQIQSCGGKTKAVDSTKEDSSEWLTNMVKSGQVVIHTFDGGERTDSLHFDFDATSPSSDSGVSYTNTTEIDAVAQKKAEAEYEHTLKQIDTKEKKIDNELAKLETERNALTTMYDSVKKVIEDNVERTFGIFS